jgi:hypothetical protein
LILASWLIGAGLQSYRSLRQVISGLDHIVLSLLLFALAVLISLGKSGILARWLGVERVWQKVEGPSAAPPTQGIWREGEGAPVTADAQEKTVEVPRPSNVG